MELKHHFGLYGTIVSVESEGNYDCVDKAIQENPHSIDNALCNAEKYLHSTTVGSDTSISTVSTSDLQEVDVPIHHRSTPKLVNMSTNQSNESNEDSQRYSESLKSPNSFSESSSSIAIVDDQSISDESRLIGHATNSVKKQGKEIECLY
ncbi:unnamed protein product [Rotaria sordida]|uniref:Uncharacterized protein n=1 Tax=Rotaria sordida TaxID=392033 RepID=A0A815R3N6_9BILA|nr:unnamed protein product [Rotaria sordida]CAF1471703.1 unnamed protein product [Rotaria sordida]